MWWFILFISAFSSIFPPMLRRLIGRYWFTSLLFCMSGFVIGMIFAFFHLSGKTPFLRQLLYNAVMLFGNILNVILYISTVIPSSPGAFLLFIPSITLRISSLVNSQLSGVFGCRASKSLACLWWLLSSSSLFPGVKCSSISLRVSFVCMYVCVCVCMYV